MNADDIQYRGNGGRISAGTGNQHNFFEERVTKVRNNLIGLFSQNFSQISSETVSNSSDRIGCKISNHSKF